MNRELQLTINAKAVAVTTDDRRSLLDVLREDVGLTGAKFGCGEGGACTVLVDGRAVRSCITSVGEVAKAKIETIESLATGDKLHPVQQAFLED